MRTVAAFDAKNRLGSLLDLVEQGEEVTITRHGKPVAKLVAPVEKFDRSEALKAVEEIRKMRKGVTLGGLSIKDMINEGRK
ncbi:MAG: type II toxin-antitoxin system prevent-host-death family antitoxin [Mesorhizobium sp.]|nr:type II toxin-antitoxin system prevent-host-death family antitoxin [Mesorhizobium sp.]MBN9243831.1 type II toxin-antitoxin system prevent-host-death family antitoxin [Mesorhizobium sp.]